MPPQFRRYNCKLLAIFGLKALYGRGSSVAPHMSVQHKILLRLPSQPEIYTATSGARAIALLDSEPFSLLISDLSMPKMDGLQVLTIVQSKSLVDIIQIECLSRSSSVLKVTNGALSGKIWFNNGDVIDAETQALNG